MALPYEGLELQNGKEKLSVPAGANVFTFPDQIGYGTEYHVVVSNHPKHMTCEVLDETGHGSAGHTAEISVVLKCLLNTHFIKGSITGLTADGLRIVNGSDGIQTIQKGEATFTYAKKIAVGAAYGLTILSQPTGLACAIENGTDIMGDEDRTDIHITCASK